jgi:hemerythrin-like metal-binding protein
MALHWSTELELGIGELDVQQQELFAEFELFSEAVEKEYKRDEIDRFIAYLGHYTEEHFGYEERLQERANFPGREEHLAAHRHFVEEVESFKAALNSGKDSREVSIALKGMMIRWIITHSRHLDLQFNNYLLIAAENAKQESASKKLGEILVEYQTVSQVTVDRALVKQQQTGQKLGLILVEMGVVSKEDISKALLAQEGRSIFTEKLGHILVESGLIAYETLERALESQKLSGKLVGAVLVAMGVIDVQEVMFAQAIQKGMLQRDAIG